MEREEMIAKIASELLDNVIAELEAGPLDKEASEEDKVEAVAQKLAEIYNEQAAIKEAAEEYFQAADQQEKVAYQAIDECGYELTEDEAEEQ